MPVRIAGEVLALSDCGEPSPLCLANKGFTLGSILPGMSGFRLFMGWVGHFVDPKRLPKAEKRERFSAVQSFEFRHIHPTLP